ncbi:MAG: integrase core domain-containing protein [Nitrospira sp.]|nr:integrase core domain-containing protein [Nitrospira sp.]
MRNQPPYYGTEFPLALTLQEAGIRLRHIQPRRPEQNGKVERSHRIDEEEFWSRSTGSRQRPRRYVSGSISDLPLS